MIYTINIFHWITREMKFLSQTFKIFLDYSPLCQNTWNENNILIGLHDTNLYKCSHINASKVTSILALPDALGKDSEVDLFSFQAVYIRVGENMSTRLFVV